VAVAGVKGADQSDASVLLYQEQARAWEVFWAPTLGFFQRLRGQSEDDELRGLALAISRALDSLPGIQERRWYPS
jgi:hypothetical protein